MPMSRMSFSLPESLWEEAPIGIGVLIKKHAQREAFIKIETFSRALTG